MFPFPLFLLEPWGDLSLMFSLRIWSSRGVKTHKTMRMPPWLHPTGVFNSRNCSHWTLSNLSITVQVFLSRHQFPTDVSAPGSALVHCASLYEPSASPMLRAMACPMTSLLWWVWDGLLIFQFVQLFIFIRTEWQLLSSLQTGLETRS